MIAALQKLQSRLGTQHDADVLARYLTQLAAHPPADFTAATLFMMGRMAQLNAAEAARLGETVEKPWRKMRDRRWSTLRWRMQQLRDDTRKRNKKIGTARHTAAATGKRAGAGDGGRHARAGGNGRVPGAAIALVPPHAGGH